VLGSGSVARSLPIRRTTSRPSSTRSARSSRRAGSGAERFCGGRASRNCQSQPARTEVFARIPSYLTSAEDRSTENPSWRWAERRKSSHSTSWGTSRQVAGRGTRDAGHGKRRSWTRVRTWNGRPDAARW
jgi:hypothetical protein